MDCREIKELIPIYLDGELESQDHRLVAEHLLSCEACRAEAQTIEKSWEMLGELDPIEPDPNYMTRFRKRISEQTSWHEKILDDVRDIFANRRFVPALAAAGIIFFISILATYQFMQKPEFDTTLSELNEVDFEMVEHIDLAENFDIIQEIEFFSDLEIIESLNDSEAS